MNAEVRQALARDRAIDFTTTGRTSGQPRRLETWFHNLDGTIYLTGLPGKRDWYANLLAEPRFTFHLKESVQADLPARAHPIVDPAERRRIMGQILSRLNRPMSDLDAWVSGSPLVEVSFE